VVAVAAAVAAAVVAVGVGVGAVAAGVAAAAVHAGDGAAGAKFRDLTAAQSPRGPSRETHPAAARRVRWSRRAGPMSPSGPSGGWGMSAIPPLSGDKQTSAERGKNDARDPEPKSSLSARAFCR
jgi:hypothetical protein